MLQPGPEYEINNFVKKMINQETGSIPLKNAHNSILDLHSENYVLPKNNGNNYRTMSKEKQRH